MDKSERKVATEVEPAETETMIIGNTKYTINTFYDGKETYADILKRMIIRDLERTEIE